MIKAPIDLQDLRRRIYDKAKADLLLRSGAVASAGNGGVGVGCTTGWDSSTSTRFAGSRLRKPLQQDGPHNPWREVNRRA